MPDLDKSQLSSLKNVVLKSEVAEGPQPSTVTGIRHPREPSESEILLSRGVAVNVVVDGEVKVILIKPFKFKDLDAVIEATAPFHKQITGDVASTREKALNLLTDSESLIKLIRESRKDIYKFMQAFNAELTEEFVDELHVHDVAELLITIITVNVDFFIREVSPNLLNLLKDAVLNVIPKLTTTRMASQSAP